VPSIYYYFWGSTLLLQFPIETFAEYNESHVLEWCQGSGRQQYNWLSSAGSWNWTKVSNQPTDCLVSIFPDVSKEWIHSMILEHH
jgi:hypothetical protein